LRWWHRESAHRSRLPPSVHGNGDHGSCRPSSASRATRVFPAYWVTAKPLARSADSMPLTFTGLCLRKVRWSYLSRAWPTRAYRLDRSLRSSAGHLNVPVVSKSPRGSSRSFWLDRSLLWHRRPCFQRATPATLGWRPIQPGLICRSERGALFSSTPRTPSFARLTRDRIREQDIKRISTRR